MKDGVVMYPLADNGTGVAVRGPRSLPVGEANCDTSSAVSDVARRPAALNIGASASTTDCIDVPLDVDSGTRNCASVVPLVHSKRPRDRGCIAAKSKFQRRRLDSLRQACTDDTSDDARPNRQRQTFMFLDTFVDLAAVDSFVGGSPDGGVNSLNSILPAPTPCQTNTSKRFWYNCMRCAADHLSGRFRLFLRISP